MANVIINESAKRILQEKVYKGKVHLNTLDEISLSGAAAAQVSKADTIISENIKKDVTILGVEGSYEGTSTKLYIYEKGEDSNVEFVLLYKGLTVDEGTNLTVGIQYTIMIGGVADVFINGVNYAEDVSLAFNFTLTEDMSVNNKVVITVKRHEEPPTNKFIIDNRNGDEGTTIYSYNVDEGFTIPSGDKVELNIAEDTIGGIASRYIRDDGDICDKFYFDGMYKGVYYTHEELQLFDYEGDRYIVAPDGDKSNTYWFFMWDGEITGYGTLTIEKIELPTEGSDIILSNGDEVVDAEGNDLTVDGESPEPPIPEGKFKVINNSSESVVRVEDPNADITINKNSEGSFNPRDDGSPYWFYVEPNKQISAYYTGEYHGVNYIDRRLTIDPASEDWDIVLPPNGESLDWCFWPDEGEGTLTITNQE